MNSLKMEIAAKIRTQLALSGLLRVVSILKGNFGDVTTIEEMKPLNDFVDYKIDALTREANFGDFVRFMPCLEELQVAALELEDQLDLYEYEQIEKGVNSSSSEPIPNEKVLPTHLRNGLNKLMKIVKRVKDKKGKAQPVGIITPTTSTPYCDRENQYDAFVDFLVDEFGIARPVIKSAISDIFPFIEMLGSNSYNYQIWEQLKYVVRYHIQAVIENVKFDDLALSTLQFASLQLDLFNANVYYDPEETSKREEPSKKEEPGPNIFKSPLRIGLRILLKFIEQAEKRHPFISSNRDTREAQANTIAPTLRVGVEKWLKFVEQLEKEHPFEDGTTHPQAYTDTTLNTIFFHGFLSTMSLEIVECQEKAVEIMRNHKENLKNITFGWTDTAHNIDTCELVLERLEPDRNLEGLSIICYSSAKFPNWMVKENWLPCLRTLRLRSCRNLKVVPFLSPHLQKLLVENCHELIELPPVPSLKWLKVVNCHKLRQLPDPLSSLEWLEVENCHNLKKLPQLPFYMDSITKHRESMQNPLPFSQPEVSVDYYHVWKQPPRLLDPLLKLRLIRCPKLHSLANLSSAVTHLTIEDCPKLTRLGKLPFLSIRALSILKCPMLWKEDAVWVDGAIKRDTTNRLPYVEQIETDDLLLVLGLIQQQAYSSITYLTLRDCAAAALPNLEMLSSLKHLSIEQCPDVEYLPNLPNSLEALSIGGCPKLKEKYEEGGPLHNTISHIPVIKLLN